MRKQITVLFLLVAVGWVASPAAWAQMRGGRMRGGPRGGRGPMTLTPEQRAEMYDRVAEHHLRHYTEDYELTDEQRETVRQKLDELKAAQREYAEPRMEEFRALREEMSEMWRNRRSDEPIDENRMDEIRDRMRSLWEESPLMNRERAAGAIEPLLPAEQVEKAHQRQEQRRAEWEQRRAEWEARRGEFRRRGGEDRGDRGRGGFGRGFGRGDSWDRYLETFSQRYELDESQRVTADSILRTLKEQRNAHRAAHEVDYQALRDVDDREQRRTKYEELNAPVDKLFEELRERLMKLPTSAQMAAAEARQPTSRPAEAVTSRPARATSRPAGDEDRSRTRGRGRGGRRGR